MPIAATTMEEMGLPNAGSGQLPNPTSAPRSPPLTNARIGPSTATAYQTTMSPRWRRAGKSHSIDAPLDEAEESRIIFLIDMIVIP